jgi:hypothetical protein
MTAVLGVLFVFAIVAAVISKVKKGNGRSQAYPVDDRSIVCPYCGTLGSVTTRKTKLEYMATSRNASGAVLAGGRKQKGRQHTCGSCHLRWVVA